MFKYFIVGVLVFALGVTASFAQGGRAGGTLRPGEPAPTLSQAVWLKGEPAPEWRKGHVYVLDFWATWCGPCIASIPHLNDLQKQYKDKNVHVIGVAVWPRPGMKPTKSYVESRGDDMNYIIAEDVDNKLARAFMEATNSQGIPTAMVIDGEGRLAWIGHPMAGMDSVVERVVAGTFNLNEEVERRQKEEEQQAKANVFIKQFQEAQASENWDSLVEAADKLLEIDSQRYGQAGLAKYYVTLVEKKDIAKAGEIGRQMVNGIFAEIPMALNAFAWMIIDDASIDDEQRDFGLALLAARKGAEGSKWLDASVIDTLARVYFEMGDAKKAVEHQAKAVEIEQNAEQKKAYETTLEKYKAGAAAKG